MTYRPWKFTFCCGLVTMSPIDSYILILGSQRVELSYKNEEVWPYWRKYYWV